MKHNFKNYLNPYFIETGTYMGDGVQAAIDANFNKIISIELSEKYYIYSKNRFKDNKNIEIYKGDSINILPTILKEITENCTFWLDGHFSGGDTACGINAVPLKEELDIISKHVIKTHTIMIDDIRLLRTKEKEWCNLNYNLTDIENLIYNINEKYKIIYIDGYKNDDILVAYVDE